MDEDLVTVLRALAAPADAQQPWLPLFRRAAEDLRDGVLDLETLERRTGSTDSPARASWLRELRALDRALGALVDDPSDRFTPKALLEAPWDAIRERAAALLRTLPMC